MKIKKTTYIRSHLKKIVDQMFDSHERFQLINLSYVKEFEKLDAKKIVVIAQRTMKQEIVSVVVVVIEAIKSEVCVKHIEFFDFTMFLNLLEFHISVNSANFLRHLIEIAVNYQKKSVIKILFQCLRDFALQWFKHQFKFTSLNDFKIIITKIFSVASFEFVFNFDQTIIDLSSQKYHTCFQCSVQFSSTSRFLIHVQKNFCFKIFTCKHCEKIMTSNNKLHEHVRLHHNKTLRQRFVEKKNNHIDSSITSLITSKISKKTIATSSKTMTKSSRF